MDPLGELIRSLSPLTAMGSLLLSGGREGEKGQWRSNGMGRVGKVQAVLECRGPLVPGKKKLCTGMKLLTDLGL